jgi:hypothetical protein
MKRLVGVASLVAVVLCAIGTTASFADWNGGQPPTWPPCVITCAPPIQT